jgi:glycosyltransferase involved in cell wall biosynthesis
MLATDAREHWREYDKPTPYFGTAPAALLEGFALWGAQAEVHVVSCMQRPMQCPERLASNTWFHPLLVPKIGWLRTGYQGCIRAVRRFLADLRPDIVHAQGTERDCALCGVFSGYPNVLTIHGNQRAVARLNRVKPLSYLWFAARLESFVLPRTGGVFCNSEHTENQIRPWARRVWRVPNALNPLFFAEPASHHPAGRPILVNVGTILPNKGQIELLDLGRLLHEQGLDFELQFIGPLPPGASYSTEFMQRVTVAEVKGYARYLGAREVRDLVGCLDAASAIIHAPQEEAFGLAAAEGLARNLKLFGFQTGGLKDVAAGVEGAELLPTNDWAGLREAVARWLQQGHPRPKAAAGQIQDRYHPRFVARRHIEIYREFLSTSA